MPFAGGLEHGRNYTFSKFKIVISSLTDRVLKGVLSLSRVGAAH
jgi:hypothetical protein